MTSRGALQEPPLPPVTEEREGLMWGVAEEFLSGRPDYAWERSVLSEASDRLPSGPALALADLSESVSTAFQMGMNTSEIVALLNVTAAYVGGAGAWKETEETCGAGFI